LLYLRFKQSMVCFHGHNNWYVNIYVVCTPQSSFRKRTKRALWQSYKDNTCYENRLNITGLESLNTKRIKRELVFMFKLISGEVGLSYLPLLATAQIILLTILKGIIFIERIEYGTIFL